MTKENMLSEVAVRATDIVGEEGKRITKKDTTAVIEAFVNCVMDNLKKDKGEKIPLPGIGSFAAKHVESKSGIIQLGDKKGQTWEKPACDQLVFKFSKAAKTID